MRTPAHEASDGPIVIVLAEGKRAKLAFEAPKSVGIVRTEVDDGRFCVQAESSDGEAA